MVNSSVNITSIRSTKSIRTACLLLIFLFSFPLTCLSQDKSSLILDADTGNEVDDLFAISRALVEPTWEIIALNATQWQSSQWAITETMENSHRLNQVLLGFLDLSVPTKRGGAARMYDWGDKARHSAAAYEIIQRARNVQPGQKLMIVALGALTNVASAIYIDPSIASSIQLFWLGTTYNFDKEILNTTDFNCMMDLQAVHILLNSAVEMHIMPTNVASAMVFTFTETVRNLEGVHPLGDFLCDRWFYHLDGGRKTRVIWDLALIEAIIHPEWTEKVRITTSPDHGSREINYYSSINQGQMKADFFGKLKTYLENLQDY